MKNSLSQFIRQLARKVVGSHNKRGSTWTLDKENNMAKVIKDTKSGLYFVERSGFTGTAAQATRYDSYEAAADTQKCVARFGVASVIENAVNVDPNIRQNANGISYAPNFIRKGDVRYDGSVAANANNPSKRRFATRKEAQQHIDRFVKIEGHVGGYITESRDPVNAYINWATGFSNPEIGKARHGNDRQVKA